MHHGPDSHLVLFEDPLLHRLKGRCMVKPPESFPLHDLLVGVEPNTQTYSCRHRLQSPHICSLYFWITLANSVCHRAHCCFHRAAPNLKTICLHCRARGRIRHELYDARHLVTPTTTLAALLRQNFFLPLLPVSLDCRCVMEILNNRVLLCQKLISDRTPSWVLLGRLLRNFDEVMKGVLLGP